MADVRPSEAIDGVSTVHPTIHGDERGVFVETYRRQWFPSAREMVQGNRAERKAGSVVGLHYHLHQSDYWYVTQGHARVVLHDLRIGSPTEGATQMLDLGERAGEDHRHLGVYIPPGVAHGFASITDLALAYLVDRYYDPVDELGVAWDDPAIGADWGLADPILSERDRTNPERAAIEAARHPRFPRQD
ncbi:dTDP-4-dehydrorhamnose 3,5-epimerase family protein [Aquihabitans sp. McL0605]|uniref:dTDP-4-dehydrorhamnose 3,5-epimerase family protein n=1 Tax=Aquihabitans sp. McL0605 TaxID=3415671 RepID=UPI003CE7288D